MMPFDDKISVVLVEPQSPGNVGMVCRAMKNMGLSHLRIVKGCDIFHKESLKFAVSARDLLEKAQRFESLEDALADTSISIATTRRHGKYRPDIMSPPEVTQRLRPLLAANSAAFVFGREDSGLTTDEVALCTWQSTIDTSGEYGSLNLSQAVLIFCYELFQGLKEEVAEPCRELASSAETEALYVQMEKVLDKIGFLNKDNPAHLMRSLRRIYSRAGLDSREVSILRGIMTQTDWAASEFKGVKKP